KIEIGVPHQYVIATDLYEWQQRQLDDLQWPAARIRCRSQRFTVRLHPLIVRICGILASLRDHDAWPDEHAHDVHMAVCVTIFEAAPSQPNDFLDAQLLA